MLAIAHLARLRNVRRRERTVEVPSFRPPVDVARTDGDAVQHRRDGVGELVVRRYAVDIASAEVTAAQLIERFANNPNEFVPAHVAAFHDMRGRALRGLHLGREAVVEIPGPWDGPVRVDRVDATSITLVTLDDHLEAGQIRFEAIDGPSLRYHITSWARAGDRAMEVLHVRLRLAMEAQTAMWVHVCRRAVAIAGGRRVGPIEIDTELVAGSQR